MSEMLVRLNRTTMSKMKRDVRAALAGAGHSHALEAVARGLGANSFAGLRAYARDFGGILWNGDDAEAVRFLAERGVSVKPGALASIAAPHVVDHEPMAGSAGWIGTSAAC